MTGIKIKNTCGIVKDKCRFYCQKMYSLEQYKKTLENTEGAIKNGQYRETGNKDEDKQNKNTTQYVMDATLHKQTQIM